MKTRTLLLLVLMLSLSGTSFAQRISKDSVRIYKSAYKKYLKEHTRRGYPDVTTVNGPLITVFDTIAGPGISFSHLHFLDEEGRYATLLSIIAMFNSNRLIFGEYLGKDSLLVGDRSSFCIAPGFTWHPMGNNHKADFHLVLQLPIGYSRSTTYYKYYQGYSERRESSNYFLSALLAGAAVNFQTKQHFVFGLNATAGPIIFGGRGVMAIFGASFGRRY